jgi:endonuclease/exonuclease/phosphatase family metal-dependent hydrolase
VVALRVLSWNLFHGRDHPPDRRLFTWRSVLLRQTERNATHLQVNRDLLREFTDVIAGAEWSVCLLQEVPPRWAGPLAERCNAEPHLVLTSRNQLSPLRRRLARWNPDLIASGEGGSNLILVRPPWRITERGSVLLNPFIRRRLRERRRMALAAIAGDAAELCVADLHATTGDRHQAEEDIVRGAQGAADFARGRPLVFGGDLNVRPRTSSIFSGLEDRFELSGSTAPDAIDHLLVRGLEVLDSPRRWPPERRELPCSEPASNLSQPALRLRLSDHAPVEAVFGVPQSVEPGVR